ncbi:MAG: molecular chaperone TorD family protein, partial [Solirubrobacteraceae bacterium]
MTVLQAPAQASGSREHPGRWELLRALGALTQAPVPGSGRLASVLGLPAWSRAQHTEIFLLALPPYASIHLGPEGKLGGEGADRVAGVWRTLGLTPPADADHLATILALYSELGEATQIASADRARERIDHARRVVLWEHLWPWVPGYLAAVAHEHASAAPWAALTGRALAREVAATRPASSLPLALRSAPPPLATCDSRDALLDALVSPLRSGFILSQRDLSAAARSLGVGFRRGER